MSVKGGEMPHRLGAGRALLLRLQAFLATTAAGEMILAVVVGIFAGLGAVLFRWLIGAFHSSFFEGVGGALSFLGKYRLILIPALGGLVVGPLVYFFAREAKGHGVPEVMYAVAVREGRIRPRVAVIKSLASSACIGSGGSVGREGPIVQIGSALGSTVGQLLHLPPDRLRRLVACGAAGGISATFNAPVAGAVFGVEVILREFTVENFGVAAIASVTANLVSKPFLGDFPAFKVPPYSMVHPLELVAYGILGLMCGLVAALYTRSIYACEDLFERLSFPEYLKPLLGGLLIGAIGCFFSTRIFGVGYETVEVALHSRLLPLTALALGAAKIVATSITLGSGGSGGIFAPALFIGATFGGAFGGLVHSVAPAITAEPGAYAIVGMAALFSGAAHAPLTSGLIVFEMTRDYRIILPLFAAVAVATFVGRHLLGGESIYTLKISRRGIDLRAGAEVNPMRHILVGEAMDADFPTVPPEMPVEELAELFASTGRHSFPVVDKEGRLLGIVAYTDLSRAARRDGRPTALDIATRSVITCFPDETLDDAMRRMAQRGLYCLPVVSREDPRRMVGAVYRESVIKAYARAAIEHAETLSRARELSMADELGATLVHFRVPEGSALAHKRVKEIKPPIECVFATLRRGGKTMIPRGDTIILPGDEIAVLTTFEGRKEVEAWLSKAGAEVRRG